MTKWNSDLVNVKYMFLLHGKLMPGMEKWLGKLLIPEGKLLIPREKVVFPSEARQNILPRNQKVCPRESKVPNHFSIPGKFNFFM